jgi:hypothetical protein
LNNRRVVIACSSNTAIITLLLLPFRYFS